MLQTDRKSKNMALLSGHLTFDVLHPQAQRQQTRHDLLYFLRLERFPFSRQPSHYSAVQPFPCRIQRQGLTIESDDPKSQETLHTGGIILFDSIFQTAD
jgi:hypothetical protein